MPNWWAVAALWVAGAGALLAATLTLLPRMDGRGARSLLGRGAVLALVGLICVVAAGVGIEAAPAVSAPAVSK